MDALTFQTEVRRIEKLMYRVGMSYLGNNDDVADAVQDTLAKAWEKRNHLKKLEQFKPWMMRILTNRCIDMLRRRKRVSFFPLEDDTVVVDMPSQLSPV
ncbi:MAG: sigma-70 family RNA polymerase sigma factor, partial [Kiritimatiellae bacterium]|nr:sigma-70 family RNA polymerase sigma factor [Kiritimatiellia bacterium]